MDNQPQNTSNPDDEFTFEQPVSTLEDVGRSAAGRATKEAIAPIVGAAGAVGSGLQEGVMYFGGKGMDVANYFGADIPKEQILSNVRRGLLEGLTPDERKAVEEGRAVRSLEMGTQPTIKGATESLQEALPYTAYEPKTTAGKFAGEAAGLAAAMAEGPLTGPLGGERIAASLARAGKEALTGNVAGLGSEAAGEWAQNVAPEYEGWARLAGAIATPLAGQGVVSAASKGAKLLKPFEIAGVDIDNATAKLLAEDLRSGKANMTIEQINTAVDNGSAPSLIDMAGPKTKAYLQAKYNLTPEIQSEMATLNDLINNRANQSRANVAGFIEQEMPQIGSMNVEDLANAAAKQETRDAYKLSQTVPNAASIWSPELADLVKNDGWVRQAMIDVNKSIKGQRMNEFNADAVAKNLPYWDLVKKRLDDYNTSMKPSPFNVTPNLAGDVNVSAAKRNLVSILDDAVPEYALARGAHQEAIGVRSAPEAGGKFLSLRKTPDLEKFMGVYEKYNPEQQELFKRGLVRGMYDKLSAQSGNIDGFIKDLTGVKGQKYYSKILGPEYDSILGKAVSENLISKTKAITEASRNDAIKGKLAEALKIGGGGGAGYAVSHALGLPAEAVIGTALGFGILAKDVVLNYAEQKLAPEIVKLLQSQDPDDIARLGKLIKDNADAASVANKASDYLSRIPMQYAVTNRQKQTEQKNPEDYDFTFQAPDQISTGQASGGRIERKAGGRIRNSISAEVKRTRELLSHKTASMLSIPDDAIVTALQLANKH